MYRGAKGFANNLLQGACAQAPAGYIVLASLFLLSNAAEAWPRGGRQAVRRCSSGTNQAEMGLTLSSDGQAVN